MALWVTAFRESNIEVTNVFSTRDQSIVEFIGRGIHTGPLPGPSGDIPPTGQSAEVRFCEVLKTFTRSMNSYRQTQPCMLEYWYEIDRLREAPGHQLPYR